ncbi:MAG: DinB family protein [Chloroflexota bacterium]
MDSPEKQLLAVDPYSSQEPEIGRWLWAVQDARRRTLRDVGELNLTQALLDWLPGGVENSIGTTLYHLADIEADWLYVEVLEQPLPPELAALFPYPTRDDEGLLTQAQGFTLAEHLNRLEKVRQILLDVYRQMDLAEFRRVRSLPQYDVTPEWVLHHLLQHEAEHRGSLGALKTRAERHLVAD